MTLTTRLHLADLFDGLHEEEKQDFREFEVKDNPTLDAMLKRFENFLSELKNTRTGLTTRDHYKICLNHISPKNNPKEIQLFSIALQKYQNIDQDMMGLYMSALMNTCPENVITIYADPLNQLGYQNNDKQIKVKSDVGELLGLQMQRGLIHLYGDSAWGLGQGMTGGKIIVEGNAGQSAGMSMRGGEIYIKGDASDLPGDEMKGGKILIKGNTGSHVGFVMQSGEIHIEGNAGGDIGERMQGGEIRLASRCLRCSLRCLR